MRRSLLCGLGLSFAIGLATGLLISARAEARRADPRLLSPMAIERITFTQQTHNTGRPQTITFAPSVIVDQKQRQIVGPPVSDGIPVWTGTITIEGRDVLLTGSVTTAPSP